MTERAKIPKTAADCVDCGETITLSGRVEVGQIIHCPECGAAMEVVSLDPVEVDWISNELVDEGKEAEDW